MIQKHLEEIEKFNKQNERRKLYKAADQQKVGISIKSE